MNRVAVIFTGGTISMENDTAAGGNVPRLNGASILARTPGLGDIADVVAIDRGLTPASHFTFPQLFDLAAAVDDAAAATDVAGCVVVQGTDTIEETSFFLDLVVRTEKPVVVTGAMRSASHPGYDGPANIRDAVRCAASPALRGEGVVVVLAGSIDAADDVTKTHTSSYETFRSLNFGPLGRVDSDSVRIRRRRAGRRRVDATTAAERVHLITAHVAMDGALIGAALAAGTDGLVVEATGAGNTSAALLDACRPAIAAGTPVVLTSRCPAGRASADYAFPGGGATWVGAGAMLAGYLGGPKARIALAVGIGRGLDTPQLAGLLADPA